LRSAIVAGLVSMHGTAAVALTATNAPGGIKGPALETHAGRSAAAGPGREPVRPGVSVTITDDERLDRMDGNSGTASAMNQQSMPEGAQMAGVAFPLQPRALGALITLLGAWSLRRARRMDASIDEFEPTQPRR
jgi:hypothetical protein